MKRALVLSGGGAKGRFQYDAIRYLYDRGIRWDLVAGISVGALNGAMVAMDKVHDLGNIWDNISDRKVFTRKLNVGNTILALALGRLGILGNKPLWRLIKNHVRVKDFVIDYKCGMVGLRGSNAQYVKRYRSLEDEVLQRAILASAMMPIIWPPVTVTDHWGDRFVDGGVRDNCPLAAVLKEDPDEVYIINCAPRKMESEYDLDSLIKIGRRSLGITLNETLNRDISEFLRINELVKQAEAQGVSLKKKNGSPYKYFRHMIIEPDREPGGVLDFNGTHRYKGLGREYAVDALQKGLQ